MESCKGDGLPILNFTNEIVASSWLYSPSEAFIIGVVYPITLTFGVLGNSAFLYVVFRIQRMHTITNLYLAHLAFSDIVYIALTAGGLIYTYISSPIRYDTFLQSTAGCNLLVIPLYTTYVGSIFIVTLVTYERYQGIVNPLAHRGFNSRSRTHKLLAVSWVLSLVIGAGATLIYGKHNRYCVLWPDNDDFHQAPDIIQFCQAVFPKAVIVSELCKTLPFFIALIWNAYMYARILYALSRSDTSLGRNETNGLTTKQASRFRNQVARMLIINGSIFFICQVWTRIASIDAIVLEIFGEGILTPAQYNAILSLSRGMLFINALINPIVYNATSSIYRRAFIDAFCGCRWGKERRETSRAVSQPTTNSSL